MAVFFVLEVDYYQSVIYTKSMESKASKGEKTKDRIIKCALELMANKGVGAASLSDIANAAGIKKPSLYNHFQSREELETEVFDYIGSLFSRAKFLPSDIEATIQKYSAPTVIKAVINRYIKAFSLPNAVYGYKIVESEKYFNIKAAEISEAETKKITEKGKELLQFLADNKKIQIGEIDSAAKIFQYSVSSLLSTYIVCQENNKSLELCNAAITTFAESFSDMYQ